MITKLHLENFMSFEQLELDLGAFNGFVGPNDSGESSVLGALEYLGKLASHPIATQQEYDTHGHLHRQQNDGIEFVRGVQEGIQQRRDVVRRRRTDAPLR